ncbi:hypothetical protein [Gaoshiqia sp. Z1-71]|uniref:hypothetical protein n=1 Tax=Gaoshiqia hydrogeniformans TaxID=3290090 RepID=UPI003BF7CBFE
MKTQDQQFREMMKSYRPDRAPVDFTKKVMAQIHQQSIVKAYEPVFGRWFLPVLGVLFAVFILYALFGANTAANSGEPGLTDMLFSKVPKADLTAVTKTGGQLTGMFSQLPSVLVFALGAAALLLLLDWFIQRRYKPLAGR